MTANIIFGRSTLIYTIHAQAPIVVICPPLFYLFCYVSAFILLTTLKLLFSTWKCCFWALCPKAASPKCQGLWKGGARWSVSSFSCLSLVFICGVDTLKEASLTARMLTLYSLAAGSDLVLFRSYFLPIQRLSRQFSYLLIVYSSYSEIESKTITHTRSPILAPNIFEVYSHVSQVSLEEGT